MKVKSSRKMLLKHGQKCCCRVGIERRRASVYLIGEDCPWCANTGLEWPYESTTEVVTRDYNAFKFCHFCKGDSVMRGLKGEDVDDPVWPIAANGARP